MDFLKSLINNICIRSRRPPLQIILVGRFKFFSQCHLLTCFFLWLCHPFRQQRPTFVKQQRRPHEVVHFLARFGEFLVPCLVKLIPWLQTQVHAHGRTLEAHHPTEFHALFEIRLQLFLVRLFGLRQEKLKSNKTFIFKNKEGSSSFNFKML